MFVNRGEKDIDLTF